MTSLSSRTSIERIAFPYPAFAGTIWHWRFRKFVNSGGLSFGEGRLDEHCDRVSGEFMVDRKDLGEPPLLLFGCRSGSTTTDGAGDIVTSDAVSNDTRSLSRGFLPFRISFSRSGSSSKST